MLTLINKSFPVGICIFTSMTPFHIDIHNNCVQWIPSCYTGNVHLFVDMLNRLSISNAPANQEEKSCTIVIILFRNVCMFLFRTMNQQYYKSFLVTYTRLPHLIQKVNCITTRS